MFIGLSRWLWGRAVPSVPPRFPLAVYILNMLFAMALSVAAGIWEPTLVALVGVLAGAALAVRGLHAVRVPAPRTA